MTTRLSPLAESAIASTSTLGAVEIDVASAAPIALTKQGVASPNGLAASSASTVPLVIKRAAGQTASLIQLQDENDGYLSEITAAGNLTCPNITFWSNINPGTTGYIGANGYPGLNPGSTIHTTQHTQQIWAWNTTDIPLSIAGTAGQTGNLQEWLDNSQNVLAKVDAGGNISCGTIASGSITVGSFQPCAFTGAVSTGALTAGAGWATNATSVWLTVQGAASQTADLQQWQSSTGTVLAKVDAVGDGTFNSRVYIGHTASTLQNVGQTLNCWNNSSSAVPFVVAANNGQTADIQQWQSGTAAVLARVDSSGAIAPQNGARITSGSGVPTKPGGLNPVAGDVYLRIDGGTGTHIYFCSVGGASPTWVALV